MPNLTKAYWALAIISLFWGVSWFVSKLAVAHFDPLYLCAIRQTIGGVLLIGYFLLKKEDRPTAKELLIHFILGFFIFTCANGLTTWAIKYIPSGLGALLGCLFPFFLIILNSLLYKAKINLFSTLGLIVGFVGVGIIFYSFFDDLLVADFQFGIMLCLLGVISWTVSTLISSKLVLKSNNLSGIGYQMLFGGLQLFVFSAIMGEDHLLTNIPWEAWIYMVYLILIGSILCFMCFMYVLKNLPADISGVYAYINPIVALTLGIIFLKEPFTWNLVLGTLITFLGVYLVKKFSKTAKR